MISFQRFELRVSQFGPEMRLSTVKTPVNFGLDWHCPSISFLILKPILFILGWCYTCEPVTRSPSLRPESGHHCSIFFLPCETHYVSKNCIYFQSHLLCVYKLNWNRFYQYDSSCFCRSIGPQHQTPATICHFSCFDSTTNHSRWPLHSTCSRKYVA